MRIPAAAMRPSAIATPLMKGSQPIYPDLGMGGGLMHQVLAGAEADLEPERPAVGEERCGASGAPPRTVPAIASSGSSSARSRRWVGLSVLPWRRP